MLNWFQALLPKEDNFFRLFDAHAQSLVHGAGALRQMMNGGPATGEWCAKVVAHEEEADEIAREVLFAVRRSFITPRCAISRPRCRSWPTSRSNARP